MPLRDITREGVESAIREFDRIGLDGMLRKYGGGRSTRWYIVKKYDQKLVLRAAHELQGLGRLPSGGVCAVPFFCRPAARSAPRESLRPPPGCPPGRPARAAWALKLGTKGEYPVAAALRRKPGASRAVA